MGARVFSLVEPIEGWHLTDLENSIKLLVEFVSSVTDQTDFRPFHFNG